MKLILIFLILLTILNAKLKYKNEVLVKCNDNIDCKKILYSYKFKNITNITKTIYLIKLDNSKDAKDISKILKNNSDIKFAHPNFIRAKKRRWI